MAQAGIGFHMFEIGRMERTLERRPGFARRVFTDEERSYCESCARPASHYAARIAARGAVLKALGAGAADGVSLRRVTVTRDEAGRPHAQLVGKVAEMAQEQGVREVALSLSLTHDVAVANAVAVTDDVRPQLEEQKDPQEEIRETFKAARSMLDELERYQMDPANAKE
jgi:holo-[acyl-carrier protein] synthase